MTGSWTEWPGVALVALAVVLASSHVTWSGEQDKRVREEVTAARDEFCRALYPAGRCPKLTAGAKNRVVRGAVFAAPDNKPLEQLEPILKQYGWVKVDSGDPARTVFCRAAYAAAYLEYEDRTTIDFSSGEPACTK